MAIRTRTKYISKGQRRSVCRATLKDMKKNKINIVESTLQSINHKLLVINKIGKNSLKTRYKQEIEVRKEALKLYYKFNICGITWAACVQAVKTNYQEKLINKWLAILNKYNKENINKESNNFTVSYVSR